MNAGYTHMILLLINNEYTLINDYINDTLAFILLCCLFVKHIIQLTKATSVLWSRI